MVKPYCNGKYVFNGCFRRLVLLQHVLVLNKAPAGFRGFWLVVSADLCHRTGKKKIQPWEMGRTCDSENPILRKTVVVGKPWLRERLFKKPYLDFQGIYNVNIYTYIYRVYIYINTIYTDGGLLKWCHLFNTNIV